MSDKNIKIEFELKPTMDGYRMTLQTLICKLAEFGATLDTPMMTIEMSKRRNEYLDEIIGLVKMLKIKGVNND